MDLVADAVDEHNKLDAGQMYERFFGLLGLRNTNDEGQTRTDENETLGPSASFRAQRMHGHLITGMKRRKCQICVSVRFSVQYFDLVHY